MSDAEKVRLINILSVNLSPIDIDDDKIAKGVAHALAVAVECVCKFCGEGLNHDER